MSGESDDNLVDATIHQRTRLAIMAALAGVEGLGFNELKSRLSLTDGNLSTHLSALERAGYVRIIKQFKGRKPATTIEMTPRGREALGKYIAQLQAIIRKVQP